MFEMFTAIVPVYHSHHLSTVPQLAGNHLLPELLSLVEIIIYYDIPYTARGMPEVFTAILPA